MKATVKVENLKIFANHGCMVEESIIGSDYVVNISAVCNLSKPVFDDEIGATVNLNLFKFNIDYLQEKEHIGNSEYIKTNISYSNNKNTKLKFETKRSLITNSSEFYDLSYEYLNDCLKAGIVYRREFYNDSELESENSLMFKITLIPFGKIDTPAINR